MAREVLWVANSLKEFRRFPESVRDRMTTALRIAARGELAESAKPLRGLGSGVYEIALAYRTDAYRSVYAVRLGADIYVLHAFKKKFARGIETPVKDIEVIRQLLKRLKEQLR